MKIKMYDYFLLIKNKSKQICCHGLKFICSSFTEILSTAVCELHNRIRVTTNYNSKQNIPLVIYDPSI